MSISHFSHFFFQKYMKSENDFLPKIKIKNHLDKQAVFYLSYLIFIV